MSEARSLPEKVQTALDALEQLVKDATLPKAQYENIVLALMDVKATVQADIYGTPGAAWREAKRPDPHDDVFSHRDRATIVGGHITDDAVANLVFTRPSIGNLTIAKERIRWLSRRFIASQEENLVLKQQNQQRPASLPKKPC